MAIHYRESLPFRVDIVFHSEENDRRKFYTFWDFESELDQNLLLDVREMVPLYIDFYLVNPDENEKVATLVIETTRFNEEGDQLPITIPATPAGQLEPIFTREQNNSESTEYPWRMGYYIIKVTVNGKTYITGIQVVPNNLTLGQVKRIHQILEEETKGVCNELIFSQRTFAEDQIDLSSVKWYHDYARWLQSNKHLIIVCLEYIRKHFFEEMKTVHVVSKRAGIQDTKSERWSNSKGTVLSQGAMLPLLYMNRHKELHVDNSQNQWIKFIIQRWKHELSIILELINNDLINSEKEIQKQHALIEEKARQLENLRWLKDVPEGFRKGENTFLHASRSRIEKLFKWNSALKKWRFEIENLFGTFSYLLNSTDFKDIELTEKKPFLRNRYYHLLDDLYNRGFQIKSKEGDAHQYKAIPWPTWRVYEYYALLQVTKVLYEVGFVPRVGFPDRVESFQIQGIPEGSCFVLENETGEVRINYGMLLPYSPDDTLESNGFYSTNEHRWPDIRVDFYHKTEVGVRYSKHSIVFDAKLSRFRYLYRSNIPIKPFTQLNSYVSIQHVNSLRSVIDRVCCLFAGFGDDIVRRKQHSVTYIRLCPDEDGNLIGNEELQQFILDWLQNEVGCQL